MPNQESSITHELLSHQAFLRRLAADLVGRDADDLVQEVWKRALERPPHHSQQLRGWLARIARNIAANRWRSESRRAEREQRRARERSTGEDLDARLELRKELVEAVDQLGAPLRETVLLRYFESLAPREIAEQQNVPVATVKTRLQRGLGQLREVLDERYGKDRSAWMAAVTASLMPVGVTAKTSALVSGGMAMGTILKWSAAALVALACVFFATRTPQQDSSSRSSLEPTRTDTALEDLPSRREPLRQDQPPGQRIPALEDSQESQVGASTEAPRSVLRVVLDGVAAEESQFSSITLWGLDERDSRPTRIAANLPCDGLSTELHLEPFLDVLQDRAHLRNNEFQVEVQHPQLMGERVRMAVADGFQHEEGKKVYEARVRLVRPEFWPELTLTVLDARTREHLKGVELRIRPGVGAAFWGRNNAETLLGEDLSSPIVFMGGRNPDESRVAGLAISPAAGEQPSLIQLARHFPPDRGVIVAARAPGYAWESTAIDVTEGDRELLLQPATAMNVQLSNVQLERYAALEVSPMLCVYWTREDGGNQYVHFEPLDETLAAKGLSLESLQPGGYRVAVELGGGSWTKQPVLALEETTLTAGATSELMLALAEPPAPPKRANLGGVISFPSPSEAWSEEHVRLQIYFQPTQKWRTPDVEYQLSELKRIGGALPSWSFHLQDLPVGKYRIQLLPFLKVWMVDLIAEGSEELELVLPELAEVLAETIDGQTGERAPRRELYYRHLEYAPGQLQSDVVQAETVEPGLFRFWGMPGTTRIWPKWPNGAEREFGGNGRVFELIPGPQSVKFDLSPSHAMFFVFREDGTVLPTGPQGLVTSRDIRPVDHEGRITDGGLQRDMRVEVSTPGLYEISFEGLDEERYHAIPPRRVEVRSGETTQVIVDLRRK